MATVRLNDADNDLFLTRDPSVNLHDAVYVGAANTVFQATAASPTPKAAIGFAVQIAGANVRVRTDRIMTGFSGLTPAQPVYLSTVTGGITQMAPVNPGEMVQELGIALTTTDILVKVDTDATVLT